MAEGPETPPIPTPIIVANLCVLTPRRMLRTVTYWHSDVWPENETQLTVAADAIKTAFGTAYCNLMPDTNYFQKVECRYYGAGGTGFMANSTAAAGPGLIDAPDDKSEDGGSESEDIMPDGDSIIIQKKTGLVGRANQGRWFIGGLAERINWSGELASVAEGAAKTLAAKFATDINVNGSGYTTVLHARHWRRSPNAMIPITKVYVIKGLTHLRRRQDKKLFERI